MSNTTKLEVTVNPEDVKDAMLQQLFKENTSEFISKLLQEAWNSYETRDQLKKTIARFIGNTVETLIEKKYKEKLKEKVEQLLTDTLVEQVTEKVCSDMMTKLTDRY